MSSSFQKPTTKQVDRSYRGPNGLGFSPSLQRARKPFLIPNIIVGSLVCIFAGSVYAYAISAVKQDDFSDLEDLLPPIEDRQSIKSIEDELREAQLTNTTSSPSSLSAKNSPLQNSTSSPSAMSTSIPGTTSSDPIYPRSGVLAYLPRRLSEVDWLRRTGVVEKATGNVVVWGAPSVDNVGSVAGTTKGPKLV